MFIHVSLWARSSSMNLFVPTHSVPPSLRSPLNIKESLLSQNLPGFPLKRKKPITTGFFRFYFGFSIFFSIFLFLFTPFFLYFTNINRLGSNENILSRGRKTIFEGKNLVHKKSLFVISKWRIVTLLEKLKTPRSHDPIYIVTDYINVSRLLEHTALKCLCLSWDWCMCRWRRWCWGPPSSSTTCSTITAGTMASKPGYRCFVQYFQYVLSVCYWQNFLVIYMGQLFLDIL